MGKSKVKPPARNRQPPTRDQSQRCLVTVDLGEDGLTMLDELVAKIQKIQISPRRVTRSAVLREAILCLYWKDLKPEK